MKTLNRFKFIVAVFVLVTIVFVNYTIIVNGHFHVDENGHIVFHSHPYSKSNNSLAFPKHHHTKFELFIIAQTVNTLSLFLVVLLFIHFFLPTRKKFHFYSDPDIVGFDFYLLPERRGPPNNL